MNVLIVECKQELGDLWCNHLRRVGCEVALARTQEEACQVITDMRPDVIILDLVLDEGSALAISDFASFTAPDARVIFVTDTSFFSDGSIFSLSSNACAFVPIATPPEDLAAMVEHYGGQVQPRPCDAV